MLASAGCGAPVETAHTLGNQSAESIDAAQDERSDLKSAEDRVDGVPVSSILRLSQPVAKRGEEIELVVELRIAPMWEIHTLNAQPELTATKLEVVAPTGISLMGPWHEPETSRSVNPPGQKVHVGRAVFKRKLAVDAVATAGTHEISCQIAFQACNEHQCLKPQERTLKVPLVIE